MRLQDISKILKPYRGMVIVIMIYAIIISAIAAVVPFINSNVIDKGLLAGNIPNIIKYVVMLTVLQCLDQIIQYLQTKQEIKITNAVGKKMKVDALEHGFRLKPIYFKEQGFYKTIGDALFDIGNIMNITSSNFLLIFVIICKAIGAALGLYILEWRLALFICTLIPVKIVINVLVRHYAEKAGDELMCANKKYNTWFADILSGIMDIKLWNLKAMKVKEYGDHIEQINQSSKKMSLLTARNTLLMQNIEVLVMNSIYILGAYLINDGSLSFGKLIAVISFASYMLVPVNVIMDLRVILKQIKPSVEGIKRFYELNEENYYASSPIVSELCSLEFQNVCVSFDGHEILKDVSFKVQRGDKVAIVGDNGSGKTTIINLLLRVYEPTSGKILVNGIPIEEFNIEDYRRKFSIVAQDIHLFRGTVGENIMFSKMVPEFSDETISFCTKVIDSWEEGYETEVGAEGQKLSGGERQKIALLRALYHKSDIIILDEATASYDKESEIEFNQFIKNNTDYGFYFVVTHRSEILECMTKVLHLEDGKLVRESVREQEV